MESTFPDLWECVTDGGFVVHQSLRIGSGILMDRALKKHYNKPAKSSAGVIGFPRIKEPVCRWNIIKHEKHQFSEILSKIFHHNPEGAYTLHHEFTPKKIEIDKSGVERMVEFSNKRNNIFSPHEDVRNIVPGKKIDVSFHLNYIEVGEEEYKKFKKTCLKDNSTKLFDTIKNVKNLNCRDQRRHQKNLIWKRNEKS